MNFSSSSAARVLRAVVGSAPDRLSRHAMPVACISVFIFGTVGASSSAAALAPGYGPAGSFDPGFGVLGPGQLAVDDATGNVLVADPGNATVLVLAPDLSPGGTATTLTQFAAIKPIGIAVDQSTHAVYVAEGSPTNRIERFVSDAAPVPTYMSDPTFTPPNLNNLHNDELSLAVDPTTHDVLAGDGDSVKRFTATGTLVRSIDGSNVPSGKFRNVYGVTASSTKTYVVDYQGQPGTPATGDGVTRILQFDGQGGYEQTINATDTPTTVGIDASRNRLLAGGRTGQAQNGAQLSVFDGADVAGIANATPPGVVYLFGIAVDGGASHRAYMSTSLIGATVAIFVPAPGAHADSFTTTDPTAAHLAGIVNPEGKATTAHFEYCSERDPCATDPSIAWTATADDAVGTGSADVPISADVTGLLPHTNYRVRIAATDTQTSDYSNTATVTMADAPPLVTTSGVSDLSSTDATLTGSLAPLGIQSTYSFEYGETTSYGSRVPAAAGAGVAGNGFGPRTVRRNVTDLKPGTLYHYRLVGTNAAGTTQGADRTFTTEAGGRPKRGYEMVSPVEKQGTPVETGYSGVQASANGDALLYGSAKAALPGAGSAVFVPHVLGSRVDKVGWNAFPLDLPLDNLGAQNDLFTSTLAVSTDVRRALVLSQKKLTADAVQGGWNLYISEPEAGDPAQKFVLVATDPRFAILVPQQGSFKFVGASDDLTHSAFISGEVLYEAVLGQGVRRVSVLPDGSTASGVTDVDILINEPHQISNDGRRIYFSDGAVGGPLYLRQDGTTTIPISVSQRPGAPSTPVGASFLGASPDGRYVEFSTFGFGAVDGLTPSAPDVPGIYVYDVVSHDLKFLAEDPSIGFLVPRPAQHRLYFQTGSFPTSLWLADDGVVTKIVDVANDRPGIVRGSDNGRYYAFLTTGRLTAYDNNGQTELYLYDADTGDLSCPSCRTDGGPASGTIQFGVDSTNQSFFNRYKPRSILDDGTVFFDTTVPLVGADINGTRDVYSYRAGRATLISRGTLPTTSQFAEVTPDGSNVFFTTDDRLVGQDQDAVIDMYDARVGGGIPAQSPVPGPAPCSGSECREAGAGPTTSEPPPSQVADQAVARQPAASKAKVSILSSSFSATTLRLVVQVSGPGRIRASGDRVTATTQAAAKAGKYTLKVPLSRKTRAARKAHHKIKVVVKVTLTPPFATAATAKFSRTLGK